MREFANCPICGKLYIKNAANMCRECQILEEKNEYLVAEYVRDHPNCSIQQIHDATGIREKTILHMIKSGRLIEIGTVSYPCESCGAPITAGRLCQKCSQKLLKEINEMHHHSGKAKAAPATHEKGVGFLANYYTKKDRSH